MNLPTGIKETRRFLQTLDLKGLETAVASEARAQLVLVGPVNSGKSTLFNQLKGQKLSAVSAVPGTTRGNVSEQFGPFILVDTPGFGEVAGRDRANTALQAVSEADVAVLVLDGAAGIRQEDANLHHDLRARGLPVVVVLNKMDLVKRDTKAVIRDAELKLGVPVIPISAKHGTNIADHLIPAMISAHPRMAVTIGRALPRFRRVSAQRIVRESAGVAALIGFEPIPGLGIPLLIAIHVRMTLRLAAIYGEHFTVARARDLLGAIAGGVLVRYGAEEAVKLIPAAGWIVASAAAAAGTWGLGEAAIAFFEAEQTLSQKDLRTLYKEFRADWRKKGKKGDPLELPEAEP